MKKKLVELMLGVTITATLLMGCQGKGAAEYKDETIFGQVEEVGKNSITVTVRKNITMEKPEGQKEEKADHVGTEEKISEENKEEGETCEIAIEKNTEIFRQGMGGPMGGPGMKNGEMLEKPEGTREGEMPEKPEGTGEGEMPEKPEGTGEGEMPEKPEGTGEGEMPEKPEETGADEMPEMPGQGENQEEIMLSDVKTGDQVAITFDAEGDVEKVVVMSMEGGMQQEKTVENYDAVNAYTTDGAVEEETISSTGKDENAVHISEGASVSLDKVTVKRESTDSTGGDNASFYGVGAAILNTEGTAYVKDSTIETDAAGGAGIFSYGDGVTYVSDSKIKTKKDTSGGIHVAGGGTLYAWNLDVETDGESAAAIRSDRGSGTMVVDGGKYISNGVGSPAIYSTANIAVKDAELTANGSEAICIEGRNSIHLYDSDLTGNMAENEQNDCTWNVILYQSMSGDSEVGNSTFQMQGGSLTAKNGGMFYTTNTESTFVLSNVDISYSKNSDFFLKCTGNKNQRGWGQEGNNGADCTFTAMDQEMQGDVIWDSISQLDFYMKDGSSLKGALQKDESCAGNGGDGYCNLYIEKGSTWTVTENSTLTKLFCEGDIVDTDGDSVTIKDKNGKILVKGDSNLIVTVESYEETVDLSGAAALAD